MSLEQLIVLAIIQGVTEFLPISSSGHLNLIHLLTTWPDEGILVDVAIHGGSLFAVMAYFWRDMRALLKGAADTARLRQSPEGRLLRLLVIATLPVFAIGYLLVSTGMVDNLRTAEVVAWANLIFALVLYGSDRWGALSKKMEEMDQAGAFAVGLAQTLALIPGASRAGVTISMARLLGFARQDAARFSMLLSIPTILGLALAGALEVWQRGDAQLGADMALAAALSFLTALASIAVFMKLLERVSLTPFVIYRVVLGLVLLVWIYV